MQEDSINRPLFVCSTNKLLAIGRGQIISLFIAGTGVFATLLSNTNPPFNFPTLISLFNYVLLSTFLFRHKCEPMYQSLLPVPSKNIISQKLLYSQYLWYFLAALLDLEANFLVISAYQYTSVTSIMLLDCFTIPCVMMLSYFCLRYTYTWRHIIGTLVCTSGLGVIVLCDFLHGNDSGAASNPFIGDMLCLLGSIMYACSNVLQETIVKVSSRDAYLGYLGLYGLCLAVIQCMILDLGDIQNAHFTPHVVGYIVGFVLCLFFMYTNTSMFLQDHDATLFNLSLLTSDVYAVIFSFILYGKLVYWMYFVAFGLVVVGLTLYHSEASPTAKSLLSEQDGAEIDRNEDGRISILRVGPSASEASSTEHRKLLMTSHDDGEPA